MSESPKVFISHAGEDRERFVEPFTAKLREKGVDAWASFWEINLSDNLIFKIFNEGIENSKVFIIVLSKNSIDKPWVKKELSIGIVQQINNKSKILPIVLDDVEIPLALQDTAYQKIKDIINYDVEFNNVINSIFGLYVKPPIGSVPIYNGVELFIPSIAKIDNVLLKLCFEALLVCKSNNGILNTFEIVKKAGDFGIVEREAHDSILFLGHKGYLKGKEAYGDGEEFLVYIQFTVYGFDECARKLLKDYDKLLIKMAYFIFNKDKEDEFFDFNTYRLKDKLEINLHVLNYIYDLFDTKGFIKADKLEICRNIRRVNPELKRWLDNL